jgi:hypothetical protein
MCKKPAGQICFELMNAIASSSLGFIVQLAKNRAEGAAIAVNLLHRLFEPLNMSTGNRE